MKSKKLMDETTSRKIYNRARKEHIGLCTYCKPNKGCNKRGKWYGGHDDIKTVRNPSWKLVSKKRKQHQVDKSKLLKTEKRVKLDGSEWEFFEYKW